MIKDLIERTRSYRRFDQSISIDRSLLVDLVDLGRISSSGANLQPLKYIIINEIEENKMVFSHLNWAGYLSEWDGPPPGERPSAYIIMIHDKRISKNCYWDHGIACQSIMLGATEKNLGGCIFASFNKSALTNDLNLEADFEILMVLALGKPIEKVIMEPIKEDGSIKYYRDKNKVHHVPKRELKDVILK